MEGYKLLFQEDDCAPDARRVFKEQLSKEAGCNLTIEDFQKDANKVDGGSDRVDFYLGNHLLTISADDPYYKLYIKE